MTKTQKTTTTQPTNRLRIIDNERLACRRAAAFLADGVDEAVGYATYRWLNGRIDTDTMRQEVTEALGEWLAVAGVLLDKQVNAEAVLAKVARVLDACNDRQDRSDRLRLQDRIANVAGRSIDRIFTR